MQTDFLKKKYIRAAYLGVVGASALFVFIILCLRYIQPTLDGDVYFHLAYGREFIQNLSLHFDENKFTWVKYGKYGLYPAWIPQVIFYLLYKLGGETIYLLYSLRLFLLFAMISSLAVALYYGRVFLGILVWFVFGCFGLLLRNGMMLKADMFTVFWFFVFMGIYFGVRYTGQKKWLYAIPVVFWLWANSHIGVSLGILTIWMLVVLEFVLNRKARLHETLFIVAVLCSVAVLVTPKPFYVYRFLFSKFAKDSIIRFTGVGKVGFDPKDYILAMKPMPKKIMHPYFSSLVFISLVNLLLLLNLARQRVRFCSTFREKLMCLPWDLIVLNLIFVKVALVYGRFSHFYGTIAGWTFVTLYKWNKQLGIKDNIVHLWELTSFVLFVGLIRISALTMWEPSTIGDGRWVPVAELNFLNEKLPSGTYNMINSYGIGSYVLWKGYPKFRVFIDTRMGEHFMDYMNFVMEKYDKMNLKPEDISKQCDVALISWRRWTLIKWFLNQTNWKPVFWGPAAMVLVKKDKFPNIEWNDPSKQDFERVKVIGVMKQDLLMRALLYAGKIQSAKLALDYLNEVVPHWINMTSEFWNVIIEGEEEGRNEEALGVYIRNSGIVDKMPGPILNTAMLLVRKKEYSLFKEGKYKLALEWERLPYRYAMNVRSSLYNQGILWFLLGEKQKAFVWLQGFLNCEIPDSMKPNKKIAEKLLKNEEVDNLNIVWQ